MVGVPAAGEHGVELLSGFLAGEQAVHGVGGDALGAVDGGGAAEAGRGANVVGGQPHGAVAAGMPHCQVTLFGDVVMVHRSPFLTQSVAREAEASVVGAGDDHVADAGPVSVRQARPRCPGQALPRR